MQLGEAAQCLADDRAGAVVALADDSLTTANLLVMDRAPTRDAAGRLLNGRELGRPDYFSFVKCGTHCMLVHERTSQRFTLPAATCKAMQ